MPRWGKLWVNPHHGDAGAAYNLGCGQRRQSCSRHGHRGRLCGCGGRGEEQRGGRRIRANAAGVSGTGGQRAEGIAGGHVAHPGTAAMLAIRGANCHLLVGGGGGIHSVLALEGDDGSAAAAVAAIRGGRRMVRVDAGQSSARRAVGIAWTQGVPSGRVNGGLLPAAAAADSSSSHVAIAAAVAAVASVKEATRNSTEASAWTRRWRRIFFGFRHGTTQQD